MTTARSGRSLATVLFTDLVGSTELRSRLGDDAADVIRQKHDTIVGAAVDAHGGHVVKGLGDGVLAVFDDATGAIEAAVAVQQGVDRARLSGALHPEASLRVGISAGDVTWEGDDCFGTPVIEASRLCGACEPDGILAAEVVRVLAGSREGTRFGAPVAHELKGLAGPLSACAVEWRDRDIARPPLPPVLAGVSRSRFVERDTERKTLLASWDRTVARANDGSGENSAIGRLALVSGEPGIGKTRLLREVAIDVHAHGAIVLGGRCDEEPLLPYQALVEGLHHYVVHTAPPDLRLHGGRRLGELARILPDLGEHVAGLPAPVRAGAESERFLLFEAVADLVTGAAATAPVLLVIDDLHWADHSTLLLLRHLLRRTEAAPVLLVATYRDTELSRVHPLANLLADLRRDGSVERIDLAGLTEEGVHSLASDLVGFEIPPGVVEAVHQETEGNPFFVHEVLQHLRDRGALTAGDIDVEALGVPEGVRDVVGRRVSRLGDPANDTLAVAAVAGRDFDLSVLEVVTDRPSDTLLDDLDAALAAGLVAETSGGGRYTFTHALVRETLYAELSTTRRTRLHLAVARALEPLAERDPSRLGEIAHHYTEAAGAADPMEAARWSRRAGEEAFASLAFDEAIRHFSSALEVLDGGDAGRGEDVGSDELRCDLFLGLGDAYNGAANYDPANEAFFAAADLARQLDSPERLALAAIGAVGPVRMRRELPERVALLEEAEAALGDHHTPLRIRVLTSLAMEAPAGTGTKRECARRAVEAAEVTGNPALQAAALGAAFFADHSPEALEERRDIARRCVELAERGGASELLMDGLGYITMTEWQAGDFDEAHEAMKRCADLVEEFPLPARRGMVEHAQTRDLIAAGDFDAAEHLAVRAALSESESARFGGAAQLLRIRYEQGRIRELEGVIRELLALPYAPVTVIMALAWCLAASERHEEARDVLRSSAADGWAGIAPRDHTFRPTDLAYASHAVAAIEDRDLAETLYQQVLPYRGQHLQASLADWLGPADLFLGMLALIAGTVDVAVEHLEAALRACERSPVLTAHTQAWLARALHERGEPGDAERATTLLADADETAERLGLVVVKERVAALR